MKFEEKTVAALCEAAENECGPCRTAMKKYAELGEQIPDEERKNAPCVTPNYEVMYHEAMEKLQKTEFVQESMRNEIQQLHFVNSRLVGFREAVELIFKKDCDCHGRG